MMQDLQKLKQAVSKANSIILLTTAKPDKDTVAATLAFYLAIKQTDKQITVASSSEPIVRDSHLVAVDKMKPELGNTNLVITLDVPKDAIEKVSYNDTNERFNLVIEPKSAHVPLDTDKITFSHTGATADLVILFGASTLEDAGEILLKEQLLLDNTKIANISHRPGSFGAFNLVDPQCSLSELTTAIIKEFGLQLSPDAANNLMQGILAATDNLQSPSMTADTFEALAILYRAGAKTKPRAKSTPQPTKQQVISKPITSSPTKSSSNVGDSPQPDWLKPKIYKGTSQA